MLARIDFEHLFRCSPNPYMLLAADLTFVAVNAAYERATGRGQDELIGLSLFEAFPSDPSVSNEAATRKLRESFERVLTECRPDALALIHYPIARQSAVGVVFEDRY